MYDVNKIRIKIKKKKKEVNWKINQHKYLTLNLISLKMALTNEAKILQSYITIVILISFVQV